ncbi:hypothetical protein HYR99_31145 [Candidatus Poribacteria bacterium]|nr:hypothetical protein [Candidatus Poribacteria bacterium]
MKTLIFLSFNAGKRPWPIIQKIFHVAGCRALESKGPSPIGYYSAKFAQDAPALNRLRAILADEGIDWSERREQIFTASELETFPLLWLCVRTAPKGRGGPTYGTQYDLSKACPRCGTGAIQTSPLFLEPSEILNQGTVFQTFDSELLVSVQLAQVLNHEVKGLEPCPARSHKDGQTLSWVQLLSLEELPPMASSTKGILHEAPCSRCARDGYFHSAQAPVEIFYSRSQVVPDVLPDVVHTSERFGNSKLAVPFKDSHFAQPLLLVKPKVFTLFNQQSIRGLEFVPVNIVEP